MIRVNLGCPIGLKEKATWDWDSSTWGGRGECIGTVPVSASVRERLVWGNVRNLNGYNAVQNVRNQIVQSVIQNPRIQNVRNQNGLIVIPGSNQNPNGNGNLVAACDEGNATGHNDSFARASNSAGVKHLIPSHLTRYLNLSSGRALVNRSATWYSVPIKNSSMIPFSTFSLMK
uniref:Uncharacterized protein n=1 Tax=Tanacetum cinerariifolium TaxID=118510 RepID=A0A699HXA6_TANCI|nr:hypothetical protein [Tanacetum cinerariifolium]